MTHMRRWGHIWFAAAFAVLCFVGVAWAPQWQAKTYSGTPLGLFVADGDTITTGVLEADTAKVDTIYGRRAHFLRAWIDTLDGDTIHFSRAEFDTLTGGGLVNLSHVHIDTLSSDSLTALVVYIDTLNGDTLWFTSAFLAHLYSAIAAIEQLEVEDSLSVPAGGVAALSRAKIDTVTMTGTAGAEVLFLSPLMTWGHDNALGQAYVYNDYINTVANYYGLSVANYKRAGATNAGDQQHGAYVTAHMAQDGGNIGQLYGLTMVANLDSGVVGNRDTLGQMTGLYGYTYLANGGLIGRAYGVRAVVDAEAAMDSLRGEMYGLHITVDDDADADSLVYMLYLNEGSNVDYGIYQDGTAPNYLWGMGLGDSLTVAGNIHAANIYGDTLFGYGGNLTGIAGGDTTGLRDEWRGDISDSLAGFTPGGAGDMMAADVRDSILAVYADTISVSVHDTADVLRGEWLVSISDSLAGFSGGMDAADVRDTVLAVYGDTIHVSVHDTADAVRAVIRDSMLAAAGAAGIWIDTTVHFGSIRSIWFDEPGNYIGLVSRYGTAAYTSIACAPESSLVFAANGSHLLCAKYATDGTLTKVDSVAIETHGVAWSTAKARLVTYGSTGRVARLYQVSTSAQMTLLDTVLIYATNAGTGIVESPVESGYFYIGVNQSTSNQFSQAIIGADTLRYAWLAPVNYIKYSIWSISNFYIVGGQHTTTALTVQTTTTTPTTVGSVDLDTVYSVTSSANHTLSSGRLKRIFATTMSASVAPALTDSLQLTGRPTCVLASPSGNFWVGESGLGLLAGSLSDQGAISITDTIADLDALPRISYYGSTMAWTGKFLFVATDGGLATVVATDDGVITYKIESLFNDTTLIQGPVTIDLDADPEVGTHDFTVTEGAAYSYIDAGDGSWTASSSRHLKDAEQPFASAVGDAILGLLDRLPIQRWRYKSAGNRGQHAGPMAEDWYPIARMVAPEAADSTQISQEHVTAALLLSVQALTRRNDSLATALDRSERRMAKLERAWGMRDSTGRGNRPARPGFVKPTPPEGPARLRGQ